jgi:hypothetical protein
LVHLFLIPPDVFNQVDGHHVLVRELVRVTVKIVIESLFLLMVLFELHHFPRRLQPHPIRPQYQWLLINEPPFLKPQMLTRSIRHSLQVDHQQQLVVTGVLTNILIKRPDNMLLVKGRKLLCVNALKPFLMLVPLDQQFHLHTVVLELHH